MCDFDKFERGSKADQVDRSLTKPPSKAVINDKGERYESLRAANIAAGYSHGSGAIHGCLKSGRPDKNGNTWKYADD